MVILPINQGSAFNRSRQHLGQPIGWAVKGQRFSDSQIMAILKQAESEVPVSELCREHGMSSASFYKWRAKFGGMDTSMIKRMKELEDENWRQKKMYADEPLKAELRKEALEGKW